MNQSGTAGVKQEASEDGEISDRGSGSHRDRPRSGRRRPRSRSSSRSLSDDWSDRSRSRRRQHPPKRKRENKNRHNSSDENSSLDRSNSGHRRERRRHHFSDGEIDSDGFTSASEGNGGDGLWKPYTDTIFVSEPLGLLYDTSLGLYATWDSALHCWTLQEATADPSSSHDATNFADPVVLKLVVQRSDVLTPGSVLAVDGLGVTIGRDRCPTALRLRIPELAVSRTHASISARKILDLKGDRSNSNDAIPADRLPSTLWRTVFVVTDLGSKHGTTVNGVVLRGATTSDDAQQASSAEARHVQMHAMRLQHLDVLELGSTLIEVHIHDRWGCERCQVTRENSLELAPPSGGARPLTTVTPADTTNALEAARRAELARLKRMVGGAGAKLSKVMDRAAERRSLHGVLRDADIEAFRRSELGLEVVDAVDSGKSRNRACGQSAAGVTARRWNESKDPVAVLESAPPVTGVGEAMLLKLGWRGSGGLGRHENGITEPIRARSTNGQRGLGNGNA